MTNTKMLTVAERMQMILASPPAKLVRIDAVLLDADTTTKPEVDCALGTLTEAAKMLKISRPTVYRLVQLGRLETVALNGVRRVKLSSVRELVESKRNIDREASEKVEAMAKARFEKGNRTKREGRAAR